MSAKELFVVMLAENVMVGGVYLLYPWIVRKGLLFGVYVGEEVFDSAGGALADAPLVPRHGRHARPQRRGRRGAGARGRQPARARRSADDAGARLPRPVPVGLPSGAPARPGRPAARRGRAAGGHAAAQPAAAGARDRGRRRLRRLRGRPRLDELRRPARERADPLRASPASPTRGSRSRFPP